MLLGHLRQYDDRLLETNIITELPVEITENLKCIYSNAQIYVCQNGFNYITPNTNTERTDLLSISKISHKAIYL